MNQKYIGNYNFKGSYDIYYDDNDVELSKDKENEIYLKFKLEYNFITKANIYIYDNQ